MSGTGGATMDEALAADRDVVAALDEAVAAFKAALGAGDDTALIRASTRVGEALLRCRFRAATLRGQRRRAQADGGEGA